MAYSFDPRGELDLDMGVPLNELSRAALSDIERAIVRRLMHAGEIHPTKRAALVASYKAALADVVQARKDVE